MGDDDGVACGVAADEAGLLEAAEGGRRASWMSGGHATSTSVEVQLVAEVISTEPGNGTLQNAKFEGYGSYRISCRQ